MEGFHVKVHFLCGNSGALSYCLRTSLSKALELMEEIKLLQHISSQKHLTVTHESFHAYFLL